LIKASSSAEVRTLVDALSSGDSVRCEAAIARLAVIGSRATDRLIAAYSAAKTAEVKVAVLRAIEGAADARALPLACKALQQGGDPAVASASILGALMTKGDPATATAALDALVEAALDPTREQRVRLAAYHALQDIPGALLAKVTDALRSTIPRVASNDAAHDAILNDAINGRMPADPTELGDAIAALGATVSPTSLLKLIEGIRSQEQSAELSARVSWQEARGAVHQTLARRGSRLAVYDLRETIEAAEAPLPPSFLGAMRTIGDATCLEALAAALARSPEGDLWWRHQLASAFRAIARRERMTKRHAAMKRVLARWPEAADAIL
jgi:hypothetical protein